MSAQHPAVPPGACCIPRTLPHTTAPGQLSCNMCEDCDTVAAQAKLVTLCCSPASLSFSPPHATVWKDVLPPAVGHRRLSTCSKPSYHQQWCHAVLFPTLQAHRL